MQDQDRQTRKPEHDWFKFLFIGTGHGLNSCSLELVSAFLVNPSIHHSFTYFQQVF